MKKTLIRYTKLIAITSAAVLVWIGFASPLFGGTPMQSAEDYSLTEEDWQKFSEFMRQHPEVVEADGAITTGLIEALDELSVGQVHVEEIEVAGGGNAQMGHIHLSFEEAEKAGIQGYQRFVEWLRGNE